LVTNYANQDRGDLSNAYTAGLSEELRMTPSQLSTDVSLFYVGYILLELPATLFMKKITPNVQLSAALFSWGTFTTL
jgi:fucose permease